jgi:acyl-CoA dehydrogenase
MIALVVSLIVLLVCIFAGQRLLGYLAAVVVLFAAGYGAGIGSPLLFALAVLAALVPPLVLGVPALRRRLISERAMRIIEPILPRLGDTERVALEAGTVWWDGELFGGRPRWKQLLDYRLPGLSERERAFLDGPVETLCGMLDEWQITQQRELPPAVWAYLEEQRFFGMIIPEEYGGLGFSALANSRVVTRISSRSITAAVTVMVPNSLGPGELLLHYGTEEQKSYYLPRLARGVEIPCFALTGPEAGSDAAATQSTGVVTRGVHQGREVLGMRLNWKKRYITLAPVATLIGLAFRLHDPDGLLGGERDLGITCALIPRDTPGVRIGRRHDPMGIPFHNGPIVGEDVFVPLDAIIGGVTRAGQGWRMLMESLAAGRSISLPALSIAAAQLSTRVVGAYATVREQFDTPIGRFEGIEEPLARIGAMTYLMTSARHLTCGALDLGEKPSVISSIVKAYLTDAMRQVVADAMDIRAGSAIQRGPHNILSAVWQAVPVGITVEGANILTRSMIIYGQGAIRCHPWVQREMQAVAERDPVAFDRALFGHLGHVATVAVRSLVLGLTRSLPLPVCGAAGTRRLYQYLSRFAAGFALVSDVAMATLGGSLKRREKISGRLADALAWLYLASATLKRHHDDGAPAEHLDLVRWSVQHALYRIQEALAGVLENLPNRPVAAVVTRLVFPLGLQMRPPSDELGGRVARALLEDQQVRRDLTTDVYVPPPDQPGLGALEAALDLTVAALPIETRLRDLVRAGRIERAPSHELDDAALAAGLITHAEYEQLNEARDARMNVVAVDEFEADQYRQLR